MNKGVKLRHIRAFLDIVDEGSVTAAAQRQNISQPALSRTIAELESMLGQALFARRGRRMHINASGEVFLRHARQSIESLDAAAIALSGEGSAGHVSVGVLPTVATEVFPRAAFELHELRPECRIRVVTGPNAYLIDRLRAHDIDLMIGRLPRGPAMEGLSFNHLYEDDVVACVRPGHPLSGQPVRQILRESPLILPPKGAIIRQVVDQYLRSLGLETLRPAYETVSLAFGRGILMRSDAIWFISRGVIAHELELGELVLVETGAQFLSGAVGLTHLQTATFDGDIALLVEILKRAFVMRG